MTPVARPSCMRYHGRLRALAVMGLLCAVLAGCGSVAASSPAGAPSAGTTSSGVATAGARQVGCASVNQATAVTVRRFLHLVEPAGNSAFGITERNPALVRALFRDFCAAVAHPAARTAVLHCPADLGISYLGTFYDGSRVLATYTYDATGCQRVSLTAAGKTRATMVVGRAADAAPHLSANMAAIVGAPKPRVTHSQTQPNPGGPDKSA
jgi:hypothetical protein